MDEEYPSLAAWAKAAETDIADWARSNLGSVTLGWIRGAFAAHDFDLPPEVDTIFERETIQGPFYFFTEEEGDHDTERMNRMFPVHRVVAFGRRTGRNGVICLVIADGAYKRGSVLVLRWDGSPGTEVDEEYPSLAAWAKAAEADIAAWAQADLQS